MRRVLIDECLPIALRQNLTACEAVTVAFMGWRGMRDSELLDRVDGRFDVFLTADQGIGTQQHLAGRSFGVVIVSTERLLLLRRSIAAVSSAIADIGPGDLRHVEIADER